MSMLLLLYLELEMTLCKEEKQILGRPRKDRRGKFNKKRSVRRPEVYLVCSHKGKD